jgi:hypothetical protein
MFFPITETKRVPGRKGFVLNDYVDATCKPNEVEVDQNDRGDGATLPSSTCKCLGTCFLAQIC